MNINQIKWKLPSILTKQTNEHTQKQNENLGISMS